MAHGETRAWWADVEHLRDDYGRTDEARRRADRVELAAPRSAVSPARRTIEIRGRPVKAAPVRGEAPQSDRRRPPLLAVQRGGARPERMALWALLMGVVLILVAVSTADAAIVAGVA